MHSDGVSQMYDGTPALLTPQHLLAAPFRGLKVPEIANKLFSPVMYGFHFL